METQANHEYSMYRLYTCNCISLSEVIYK